ncbi:MAG: aminotransferase class I/II-fold pyridoxal phosphate-dependent enzyme, partial [Planctomycetes bacterium]|nr:aminotransferase class I/II-fold pyridoxal phosphate-dependent enzyme [Planctomycetota bacterium]
HTPKTEKSDWEIDTRELEAAFNDKTKAIIINTPNNPTGKVFSFEELNLIADLCNKWDVYAITDEIYEHIIYDGFEHISIGSLDNMKDRTITINSISKTYSVTGWRVGWAIANKKITDRIRKVHDFLTVGAPTPFQHAAVTGLNLPNEYYVGLNDRYLHARKILFDTLQVSGFKPFLPRGSYYIITDIAEMMPKLNTDNDFDFARKLIKLTGVASVPGFSFYSNPADGKTQLRFTFCKKIETLEIVKSRFQKAFNL